MKAPGHVYRWRHWHQPEWWTRLAFCSLAAALIGGCEGRTNGSLGNDSEGMATVKQAVESTPSNDRNRGSDKPSSSPEDPAPSATTEGTTPGVGSVLPIAAGTTNSSAPSTKNGSHEDPELENDPNIGREVAVPRHLKDGEEYTLSTSRLLEHGRLLFTADWTAEEGGGRPLTKGTGAPLTDQTRPLLFPRNFNRLSAPDSNSCAGCHNKPYGIPGGGGDIVGNVFVLGQRFDFLTFSFNDKMPTVGAMNELGDPVTLQNAADSRATIGMFGSGFIEMLARGITRDLQAIRDRLRPGKSANLTSRGVNFGVLKRTADGAWDVSGVQGIPEVSLATTASSSPPRLVICPFHQAGRVVSLREFTNNAFNHHHGIQSTERFGAGTDPDGDGFVDELSRADVTSVVMYQATMAVPGTVMPEGKTLRKAVAVGEREFGRIGCASCHVPRLPLTNREWIYTEPNPYNPAGNLQVGQAPTLSVDLTSDELPQPRLEKSNNVVWVPAYTDLKLHNMCDPSDPNREALDMQQPAGSTGFFEGNCNFITKKLWGAANEMPFGHHGQFTTLRDAIVIGHHGEGETSRAAFLALPDWAQRSVIEFLKTMQVLPPRG